MASEKRPASESGSQMVVKRQNVGNSNSKAVAISNGGVGNGALIQAVCIFDL
jgi:hypothetical protein